MRPLKNTLYVQTQNAWLNKDGENIVLKNVEREVKGRVPIHKIGGIVCFGQVSLSPALMAHCTANGITITFLNQFGKFQARVEGAVSGNVLLRREQYRIADDSKRSLAISQTIILGKVFNQRQVIRRYLRDYKDSLDADSQTRLDKAQKYLELGLNRVIQTQNNAELLGREGELASEYFAVFPHFIRHADFDFAKRTRNPPTDPVNALLSFAYTLMTHECRSALETVGLDPNSGFFHQLRAGRPSLALDMVEEFRPMIDRFVLSLINKKQLGKKDFTTLHNGAVVLKDEPRQLFLKAWHDRKQQSLYHEWFEETVPFGLLPHLQATIMVRHIRGDIDSYVPFLWK
ncbi:type I-C CRISPR-associated endonuclease Cas1c [Faucicola mancuniensis]|uniref:type I-C CRISPR-associated endonuclease Cas1c n=1 Tax=Faucicola mancuniensis TaxID=1309795 RepID=UPI0028EDB889|nr:type I-C CRISPR-associated endonuclease Cas1c [uncultured Moraxella sp.]